MVAWTLGTTSRASESTTGKTTSSAYAISLKITSDSGAPQNHVVVATNKNKPLSHKVSMGVSKDGPEGNYKN
jgi:hypothetical protein